MKEYKGKIQFQKKILDVLFTDDYDSFRNKIFNAFDLTEETSNDICIYYLDDDNDSVVIQEFNDYQYFVNYLEEKEKNNKIPILYITYKGKKEISDINISSKISENFSNSNLNKAKEKNDEKNIKIKDDNYNILKIEKNNLEKNEINNNININKNPEINEIKNNTNDLKEVPLRSVNGTDKGTDDKLTYPEACTFCKESPLYNVFYYCDICNEIMCSVCETRKGVKHSHPFYKIQTFDQYMNSILVKSKNKNENIKKLFNSFKIQENLNNVLNNIGMNISNHLQNLGRINQNDNENSNKKNYKDIIKKLRIDYNLENIKDEKIEEALIKAGGDIDKALELLF